MQDISQILLDVRDVGENILSTGKDIHLLLREAKEHNQDERREHAKDLVENILSLCAYLSALNIHDLDRLEELSNEVRSIEFSSVGLRSVLKEEKEYNSRTKEVFNLIRVLEKSANRIITLSLVSKQKLKGYNDEDICYMDIKSCEKTCDGICYEETAPINEVSTIQSVHKPKSSLTESLGHEEVCYKDKLSCQLDCDGACYEDDTNCPAYTEHFTESPFTHVQSGFSEDDITNHQLDTFGLDSVSGNQEGMTEIGVNDVDLNSAIMEGLFKLDSCIEENINSADQENIIDSHDMQHLDYTETLSIQEMDDIPNRTTDSNSESSKHYVGEYTESIGTSPYYDTYIGEESTNSYVEDPSVSYSETTGDTISDHIETKFTVHNPEQDQGYEESTNYATVAPETTAHSYYSYYSEEPTTTGYETSTESAYSYTTEEPTTQTYETTTQDLYKLSQDVYSLAQDLSTKANDISSLSSDISSKVSSMGSMVSDLNTYDDDELTKTINSVNKLTQEISSKTSEMSSGCSTMSSLASDISSASSDLPTAERTHRLRTTAWQKIASRGQDMVTAAQGVVSAAQDVQGRLDGVVRLARGLRVEEAVEAAGYEVTSKTHLVISETLGIASAVLELMNALEA